MNFLAHLFLADRNNDSLSGQLLGDIVKGRAIEGFEPDIRHGIAFHRKIDAYSDSHAVTRASRSRISPQRRRFAGVIIDVCYDHFLARHWHRYSEEPLAGFCQRVYGQLASEQGRSTEVIQPLLKRMVAYDWLGGYRHIEKIAIVLDRVAGRLTRGDRFLGAVTEILASYKDLERDFLFFFPDLMEYSSEYISARNASEERRTQHNVRVPNG